MAGSRCCGCRSAGALPHPYDDAWRTGEGELVAFLVEDGGEVLLHLPGVTEADVRACFDAVTAHPDACRADSGDPQRGVTQQVGGAVAVQGGPQPRAVGGG